MRVKTPSRLHFGILDLSREFKREYGALGLTLDDGYEIVLKSSQNELKVEGDQREKRIVTEVYETLKEKFDLTTSFEVKIKDRIPSHIGLGSTTQLTLGTGFGMLKESRIDIEVKELASILDRGRYSAIGTYGFENGGFILEGGKEKKDEISPILYRGKVPKDWRFVILCPEEKKGYDEKEEKPIMEDLEVEVKYPEKICHNVLMGILPALERRDIKAFGEHLTEIQKLVGESFSSFQEGIYHPAIAHIVNSLIDHTHGAGQSSWGPTAYGLVRADEVEEVEEKISSYDKEKYRMWIGEPSNTGVRLES
ncbi:MAG: GHMP kinase [Candidatus Thermoplasmatota archaeon]|nr:GHMP kinase [Candidatus Thermoplasmatota archaeon]